MGLRGTICAIYSLWGKVISDLWEGLGSDIDKGYNNMILNIYNHTWKNIAVLEVLLVVSWL